MSRFAIDPPPIETEPALCSVCEEPCRRIEDDALTECRCCRWCHDMEIDDALAQKADSRISDVDYATSAA